MNIIYLVLLISLSAMAKAKLRLKSEKYPMSSIEVLQSQFINQNKKDIEINENLRKIKLEIIRGNLDKAKILLLQARYTDDYSKVIQYRYLALIHFIEDQHKEVIDLLNSGEFESTSHYAKICFMKTLSYLALKKTTQAGREWSKCRVIGNLDKESSFNWITILASPKTLEEKREQVFKLIGKVNAKALNVEQLKLYLKMALYFNISNKILSQIKSFSYEALQNKEIRELIGFMYYREGQLVNAAEFLDKISTPNIENIQGNYYLLQEKYELAYAQYKVALKKKNDSQNALKRLIPLSWKLKQWESGIDYSLKLRNHRNNVEHLRMQAAFLSQLGKHNDSNNLLKYIIKRKEGSQNWLLNLQASYNYLMLKDNLNAKKYSSKSCLQGDGLSCMFQFHYAYWDNFAMQINSEKDISSKDLLDEYRSEIVKKPIGEEAYISQKHLEELERAEEY